MEGQTAVKRVKLVLWRRIFRNAEILTDLQVNLFIYLFDFYAAFSRRKSYLLRCPTMLSEAYAQVCIGLAMILNALPSYTDVSRYTEIIRHISMWTALFRCCQNCIETCVAGVLGCMRVSLTATVQHTYWYNICAGVVTCMMDTFSNHHFQWSS